MFFGNSAKVDLEKIGLHCFIRNIKTLRSCIRKKNIPLQIELETETETIKNILLIKHTLLN